MARVYACLEVRTFTFGFVLTGSDLIAPSEGSTTRVRTIVTRI